MISIDQQQRGSNCLRKAESSLAIKVLLLFFVIGCCYSFASTETSKATNTPAVPINAAALRVQDVFSDAEISALLTLYDNPNGPPGRIAHGRHGWTHYIVDSPNSSAGSKGLVVLCHGVLVSSLFYKQAAEILTANGYTVLRYDFFGHGYSKWEGKGSFVEYHPDVFVDQLEDVLEAAAAGSESCPEILAFIGHSTGSLVGIYAEERWRRAQGRRHIPKLILASPAIWAHKPLIAVLADKFPVLLTFLLKKIPSLHSLVHDAVFVLSDETFAVDPLTGEYFYPEEKQRIDKMYHRLFGREDGTPAHPFLTGSFLGVNRYMLRADLLPGHVRTLKRILASDATKVLLVWGHLDLTVPYRENIAIARDWEKTYNQSFQIETLKELGHDLFLADTDAVMKSIIPFLDRPS